jgi:hypothetical protein
MDMPENNCKCKLDDDKILNYDLAVDEEFYQEHKKEVDKEYFADDRKQYLGTGYIYSVNDVIQKYLHTPNKIHFLFGKNNKI